MKLYFSSRMYLFSCLNLLFLLAISCDKDKSELHDDSNKDRYTLTFNVTDFENSIDKIGFASSNNSVFQKVAATSATQTQVGYLYYWSFNSSTLSPDIALHPASSIAYNNNLSPNEFAAGFAFDTFASGQAVSFRGASEIVVRVSLKDVLSFKNVGFDISSSATGPKDFQLLYSNDGGVEYRLISSQNQFGNTNTSQAKNSFSYNVDSLKLDYKKDFYLKIRPLAGQRGTASAYNEATGIMRLDNLHFLGTAKSNKQTSVYNSFQYYIFNAMTGELVTKGDKDFTDKTAEISEKLPMGVYLTSFVSNESDSDLILPTSFSHFEDYYFSNVFKNYRAILFGRTDTINVNQNIKRNVVLKRLYSQIKFEFTDAKSLANVKKIVINRNHEPFFYAPFNTAMVNPVLDQSEIEIIPDFSVSKQITFNQFIGLVDSNKPISYTLEVYSEKELLRKFTVSSSIKNNIQLVFRGNLLIDTSQAAQFAVTVNEAWDGESTVGF